MQMMDKLKTRIKMSGVTSYSADRHINFQENYSTPTIYMTVGSVVLVLHYLKDEDRDADMKVLDQYVD